MIRKISRRKSRYHTKHLLLKSKGGRRFAGAARFRINRKRPSGRNLFFPEGFVLSGESLWLYLVKITLKRKEAPAAG
jgi:hypothetical protein